MAWTPHPGPPGSTNAPRYGDLWFVDVATSSTVLVPDRRACERAVARLAV